MKGSERQRVFIGRLNCGLPVVHVAGSSTVGWLGVAVNAGSRDECENEYGLAHFVEHTLFKGTTHRRAHHINSRMERVGGELNAYTTKETTMLYSVFPAGHLKRAMELVADLVCNSVFPQKELEREREVVLEEAASYLDSPADAVFDDFEDMIFAGTSLGHNILGFETTLNTLGSDDCRNFLSRYYTAANMALFCVGNYDPRRLIALAEKYFESLSQRAQSNSRAALDGRLAASGGERNSVKELGLHQAHTIIGARVGSMFDNQRYALALLNNILGGPGMNSLLNVELRERRGLVYTVESSVTAYTDCGAWMVYLGCENDKLEHALDIIERVVNRLARQPLSQSRLDAYKKQYCGQLLVAADNTEMTALSAGRSLLYYGELTGLERVIGIINDITAEQLQALAATLTRDKCYILTLR